MIWEYNVQIIVMACREFEMGRKKCERYWPEKKEEPFVCSAFTVHCESMESKGDYLSRVLKVTYRNSSRTVWQLHYINWPDHGVPDSIPPILELLQEMRSYQEHDDIPICIHCSAGCGRTGALCAIDYTWKLLRNQMITENFSIFDLIQDMRTQRPSVVQTKEQYELVYRTIKLLFENYLKLMANHSSTAEVPASSFPSPVSSKSDLTASCDILNLDQEEEVRPVPQPRLAVRAELKRMASQVTEGADSPVLPRPAAEADGHNGLVSQSPKRSPKDLLDSLMGRSRPRTQGGRDAQAQPPLLLQPEKQCVYDVCVAQMDEHGPNGPPISTPTQEDTPTQWPSGGQWKAQEEPEMASDCLVACKDTVCLMVEDPYFSSISPRDSQLSEELLAEDSWTDNPCFARPGLALNDQPLVLPQLGALDITGK
ncbi:hypothetical protein JZ751_014787 [Albula glossodonta]|uniref:protein-tyrosine-phosphatase n=1 Tax=Albula glossodonta TaxID=121402 RepID=A0A8T2MWE6_9TELE|nr:hypothetical protein JZ751_014787 [Albula glossodonta]